MTKKFPGYCVEIASHLGHCMFIRVFGLKDAEIQECNKLFRVEEINELNSLEFLTNHVSDKS